MEIGQREKKELEMCIISDVRITIGQSKMLSVLFVYRETYKWPEALTCRTVRNNT